jgi:hypothetical protein
MSAQKQNGRFIMLPQIGFCLLIGLFTDFSAFMPARSLRWCSRDKCVIFQQQTVVQSLWGRQDMWKAVGLI